MHQEHNIPWNLLVKNVKFIRNNKAYTPHCTGFFAKSSNTSSFAGELNHFVRKFTSTIRTFADTERAKYPSHWPRPFPTCGPIVYSDAVKAKHPNFLDDESQNIETWIQSQHCDAASARTSYSTSHGDLTDVVKVLFFESVDPGSDDDKRQQSMEMLLMLANHPEIPLGTLLKLTWGHHFGWSRVMESALRVYVLFNLIMAVATRSGGGGREGRGETLLESGAYREMRFYRSTYEMETHPMDYPAQQIPHRLFWNQARTETVAEGHRKGETTKGDNGQNDEDDPPLMHLDMAKLKEYLKLNFALLYRYDMVVRECGMDPEWESEITLLLAEIVRGFGVDRGHWVEEEGEWSIPVFV